MNLFIFVNHFLKPQWSTCQTPKPRKPILHLYYLTRRDRLLLLNPNRKAVFLGQMEKKKKKSKAILKKYMPPIITRVKSLNQ